MTEVLGVAFLLLGFTVGYLVLSGKLPSSQPIVRGTSASNAGGSGPATPATQPLAGSMGLPTMVHLSDQSASMGAYQ